MFYLKMAVTAIRSYSHSNIFQVKIEHISSIHFIFNQFFILRVLISKTYECIIYSAKDIGLGCSYICPICECILKG